MGNEVATTSTIDTSKAVVKAKSVSDALKAIGDVFAPVVPVKTAPLPDPITDAQRQALESLGKVYGVVSPTERRALSAVEQDNLLTEREELDKVEALIKPRKDAIRTIIYNHFDVEAEKDGLADETTPRDKDGFYILAGFSKVGNHEKGFKREPREGTAGLSVEKLKELDEEGVITHDEFLKVTQQVRVVKEGPLLELLKKRPELHKAIAEKVTYTGRSAALNLRKA